MSRWYYTLDNKQRLGPVTPEELRRLALSGTVRPGHMVMPEGGGKWVPAATLKGLFPDSAAPPLPSPAPAKRPRRWGLLLGCGLFSVVLLVLFVGGLAVLVVAMSGGRPKDRGTTEMAAVAGREDAGKPTARPASPQPEKPTAKSPEEQPDTPADEPAARPSVNLPDIPVGEPADKPAAKPAEKPPAQPRPEKPVQRPAKESTDKPAEKPAPPPEEKSPAPAEKPATEEDKPLLIEDLMARIAAQRKAVYDAVIAERNGNAGTNSQQLGAEHRREQNSWVGRKVKGVGQVSFVSPNHDSVRLDVPKTLPPGTFDPGSQVEATPADEKDPVFARLSRGQAVEFQGTIVRAGVHPTWWAVVRCTFKLTEGPADKPPLLLKDLIAKIVAQKAQLEVASQSGNANMSQRVMEANNQEQQSWVGRRVKGAMPVTVVASVAGQGSRVLLDLVETDPRGRRLRVRVEATPADQNDPLLSTLTQGQAVDVQGILTNLPMPAFDGPIFSLKDSTFTLKK